MYVPNCQLLVASNPGFEMDKRATGCNCLGYSGRPHCKWGLYVPDTSL